MVGVDFERIGEGEQECSPFDACEDNGKHIFVVHVVVAFRGQQCPRDVRDRMLHELTVCGMSMGLVEDGADCKVGGVGFDYR